VARRSALHDQLRHVCDVPQFEQVAGDEVLPVVLGDLLLEERNAAGGAAKALARSHDADVVPHQAAKLVPVLGDDDGLVGCPCLPDVPIGNLRPWCGAIDRRQSLGGAVGEDQPFEK
jgi:hypothetical protein